MNSIVQKQPSFLSGAGGSGSVVAGAHAVNNISNASIAKIVYFIVISYEDSYKYLSLQNIYIGGSYRIIKKRVIFCVSGLHLISNC